MRAASHAQGWRGPSLRSMVGAAATRDRPSSTDNPDWRSPMTSPIYRRGGTLLAAALTALALSAPGAAHAASCPGADTTLSHADDATLSAAADAMVCLVNDARSTAGVGELETNSDLTNLAQGKADDYVSGGDQGYCDGVSAAGVSFSTCLEARVSWQPGPAATAQQLFDWWMNRPEDRATLLNGDIKQIGTAVDNGNHAGGFDGDGATADLVMIDPGAATPPAEPPANDPPANDPPANDPPANDPPANDCASAKANYDTPVRDLGSDAAEMAVFCLVNEQRKAGGGPELALDGSLAAEGHREAQESVDVQWWSQTDGLASHENPQRGGQAKRIAASGYCANGTVDPNENTFFSSGSGPNVQFPSTPRGAVGWWMQDPPHHDTLMNARYTHTGVGVIAGSPVKGVDFDPKGTFVQEFGACA